MSFLSIQNLSVKAGSKLILDKISLEVAPGEICVIMGPNGSGKSTLANALMGHPAYEINSGRILFKGQEINDLKSEERAALGLFLSFQSPREVGGIELYPFLFAAHKALAKARGKKADDVFAFRKKLDKEAARLKISSDWGQRYLNRGLSGGEKKKSEILQLAALKPDFAIFDEVDSGLDIDALKEIGRAIKRFKKPSTGAILVTHYPRILKYVPVDKVVVMSAGKIIASGGPELATRLEAQGFNKSLN